MKFFKKLKSSNFWVSMISAVVLILQAVFNIDIKTEYLSQIIMAMLGVLVMTGIVSDSPSSENQNKQDINVNNLMQNLGQIFTQTIANIENNMLSIVTQFEKVKESFNGHELKSFEQNVQDNADCVQNTKSKDVVEQNLNIKIDDSKSVNDEEQVTTTEQHCEEIDEIKHSEQIIEKTPIEQDNVQEIKTSNLNVL